MQGRGSLASLGRRVVALIIDWFTAMFVARLIYVPLDLDPSVQQWFVLGTFAVMVALLTWLAGSSLGQRIVGIGVSRLGGGRVPLRAAVVRTVLICLVIPAVVWDRDGRGLHDKIAGTIVLRTGGPASPGPDLDETSISRA
jgi:uncharacterized RDD family membrane protein YckC